MVDPRRQCKDRAGPRRPPGRGFPSIERIRPPPPADPLAFCRVCPTSRLAGFLGLGLLPGGRLIALLPVALRALLRLLLLPCAPALELLLLRLPLPLTFGLLLPLLGLRVRLLISPALLGLQGPRLLLAAC